MPVLQHHLSKQTTKNCHTGPQNNLFKTFTLLLAHQNQINSGVPSYSVFRFDPGLKSPPSCLIY